MKYLSVCSGIEAASMAWHRMGWKPVAFSEIEPFPSAVLAHHYPTVPNMGDMTKFKEWKLNDSIDLLVGGTPCQSFSVAGLRKGLDDPRGNLMLTYLAIADQFKPKWLVWENVPGVLSSNGGKDFGSLLGGMAELGYGFAYCILDAQFFGIPQRRRRVFVVGCIGDWRSAAAVLFDKYSMQGNPAPKREKRKDVAGTVTTSTGKCDQAGSDGGSLISSYCMATGQGNAEIGFDVAPTLNCNHEAPILFGIQSTIIGRNDKNGSNGMGICEEIAPTLTKADQHGVCVAYGIYGGNKRPDRPEGGFYVKQEEVSKTMDSATGLNPTCAQGGVAIVHGTQDPCTSDIAFALGRNNGQENVLIEQSQVRRLTPVECARLMGFPDTYLDIQYRNRPACDGPKYKSLGNSMAVPCMSYIGKRIQMIEELTA